MNIEVNAQKMNYTGVPVLSSLLSEMGFNPEWIAVSIVGKVIVKAEYSSTALWPGDSIDVITMAVGG